MSRSVLNNSIKARQQLGGNCSHVRSACIKYDINLYNSSILSWKLAFLPEENLSTIRKLCKNFTYYNSTEHAIAKS